MTPVLTTSPSPLGTEFTMTRGEKRVSEFVEQERLDRYNAMPQEERIGHVIALLDRLYRRSK